MTNRHGVGAALLGAALLAATASCAQGEEGGGRTPPPLPAASDAAGATASATASVAAGATPGGGETNPTPAAPHTLVTGLTVPWAIAFLPGGDALVTERESARLLRVTPRGQVHEVAVIEGVSASGEGGLLGVAVSPRYAADHFVFVYFTAGNDNRIVRYRYDGRLSDRRVLVSGIPKGAIHNGGRLAFGPDGYLYASTGETGERGMAQDKKSLGGKILRMTADGRPAPDNPFGTLVWTYGHRNVQGMAWDDRGHMYATEFGQNTYDEINLIEKGHNYGWPEVEGVGGRPGYTDPLLTWSTAEASPSGLAYVRGALWAAALRGERLWRVPVDGSGRAGRPAALYTGEYGRLRAVAVAPDGTLWVGTSNKDGRGSPRDGDDRILVVRPSS
ncbi:Glucose/arabinose dehydrogenase, beta-propeller fold [Microbispora rosea]|uniref:Glucose/arabinose dehydrogenase, beta-propeller fold n=1 Tax=Microbispora rosea TaxID=58117 RepID=A0A1N7DEX3_9ACTN|nr:PQQ-dependent sugar dehydrogenase [Microbispora rosea]GIH49475.1 oxidoreductase [Microbispora rosea subsp. rosea]SIR74307.1 Glucose/arabinose dehydrogenase, beta-propeller fold [Microbispora rosea]